MQRRWRRRSTALYLEWNPSRLLSKPNTGFMRGGPTSHVAMLARSMGMPAVAGLPVAALALPEHEELVLNGDDGLLETKPTNERLEKIRAIRSQREALRVESQKTAHEQAVTRDGTRIEVAANIGGSAEAQERWELTGSVCSGLSSCS
jgi:phosphoenolpyruvate-protein kinase (PTS system EI component)